MTSRIKTSTICLSILLLFSIGWNGSDPGLRYPLSMSIAGTRLYVSDAVAGVHVYDVSNARSPRHMLTIPLRGNRGAVAQGDVLYANDFDAIYALRVATESYEVLKTIKQPRQEVPIMDGPPIDDGGSGFACACQTNSTMRPVSAPTPSGGGVSSYATFVTVDSYLYYLDHGAIVTMDISTPADPVQLSTTAVAWSAETLFPSDSHLFVGGSLGMYVFDRKDPKRPVEVGKVEHARACDPVVVSGEMAFVTLRSGAECGTTLDELMSVDISNPSSPHVVARRPTATPYGLAVTDGLLYVSNGNSGFELVDVSDPSDPVRKNVWHGMATRDFIWSGDVLYVLGTDDLKIYDVRVPENPVLLSTVN